MTNLNLDDEYQQVDQLIDQHTALVNTDGAFAIAGNESKVWDDIKAASRRLQQEIVNMLRRIKDYFFGEGEKAAKDSQANAMEAVNAMMELGSSAPIAEDHPARNPETYIKPLEGGVEFQEVLESNTPMARSIANMKAAAMKVKDANTVGKMRAVYAEMNKVSTQGINTVSQSLRKTLSLAEQSANKLRNFKLPKENDPKEVQDGIKQENKEASEEAKSETRKARIIGGVRNKLVGTMNQITAQSKRIKTSPPKSKFKG